MRLRAGWFGWVLVCSAAMIPLLVAGAGSDAAVGEPAPEGGGDPSARSDGVPDGYRLIEGDILVPRDLDGGGTVTEEGAYSVELWTDGVVPYSFDPNVDANDANCDGGSCRQLMLDAMAEWESVANVEFRPWVGSDPNFIYIRSSTGNSSHVGMIGGLQFIDLFRWNSPYTIRHELGHALGYWHEQSRTDRDAYVQINCENSSQGCCGGGPCDFNLLINPSALTYGPYDFDSVMHYGQCFFSTCGIKDCPFPVTPDCVTISVLPPHDYVSGSGTCAVAAGLCDTGARIGSPCMADGDCQQWQNTIGQRDHLSYLDRLTMSFLYPEDDWVFVDANVGKGKRSGTFFKPYSTFIAGVDATPPGGTLWLQPGAYSAVGTHSAPMIIRAPLGGVTLGS